MRSKRPRRRIEAELGPIDIWVNDAMVSVFSPIKEMKPEEYRRVSEVNYLGYVYGSLAALKRMLPRDKGVIVHVGSALAYRSSRCSRPTARASTRSSASRVAADGADPRRQPCAVDDGPDAGAQHAAIRLGQEPAPQQATAGAADLPAGGGRRGGLLGGPERPSRSAGGFLDMAGGEREQGHPRPPGSVSGSRPATRASRPTGPRSRTDATTSGSPCPGIPVHVVLSTRSRPTRAWNWHGRDPSKRDRGRGSRCRRGVVGLWRMAPTAGEDAERPGAPKR